MITCIECGKPFDPATGGRKLCSDECRQARHRSYVAESKRRSDARRTGTSAGVVVRLSAAEATASGHVQDTPEGTMWVRDRLDLAEAEIALGNLLTKLFRNAAATAAAERARAVLSEVHVALGRPRGGA